MTDEWSKGPIENILLDINGVLFDSGEDHPIDGSVEALDKLVKNGFNFCLVTNECTTPKRHLAKKLNDFGFKWVRPELIVSPAPAACSYILENNLRPRLHVYDKIKEDFEDAIKQMKKSNEPPNCLVIGDVMDNLSRDFVDESLELMLKSVEKPTIIKLGAGRYYKDGGRLRMDTGAYAKAFEYCLGVESINIGKPSYAFFQEALEKLCAIRDNTIMIGDDIISDVGGAKNFGLRGFLVRTGKYKPSDENNPTVKADYVFDNLAQAVDTICQLKGDTHLAVLQPDGVHFDVVT